MRAEKGGRLRENREGRNIRGRFEELELELDRDEKTLTKEDGKICINEKIFYREDTMIQILI